MKFEFTNILLPSSGHVKLSSFKVHAILLVLLLLANFVSCQTFNVVTIAGNGAASLVDAKGTLASFNGPRAVTVDKENNVYVADHYSHRLRKITPSKDVSTYAGTGSFSPVSDSSCLTSTFAYPEGLALLSDKSLIIGDASNGRIRKISNVSCTVTTVVSGLGGTYGVAVDSQDFIFCVDQGSNVIRKISPQGVMSTWASGVAGPLRLTVDSIGNLFVTEYNGNIIKKIDSNAVVTIFAGKTAAGYNDGFSTAASFNMPWGMTTDAQRNVYVADYSNHRIRKLTPSGYVTTIAGSGNPAYQDGVGTLSSFYNPTDIAFDTAGNMIISDLSNQRIRKILICYSPSTFNSVAEACFCNAGYQYLNSTCSQCPLSYFQTAATSVPCSRCSDGTESNVLRTGCTNCPLGKYRNSGMSQCDYCSIGYEPSTDKSTCNQCLSGTFRYDNSTGVCLTCPDGATCNSTTIIKCKLGYRTTGAACIQCPLGTEQSSDGSSCVPCLTGYSRPSLLLDSCAKCQVEGSLSCNSTSIQCANGYNFDALTVAECRRNYSVSLSTATITLDAKTVSLTQSVFIPGTSQINSVTVTEIMTNSITFTRYQTATIATTATGVPNSPQITNSVQITQFSTVTLSLTQQTMLPSIPTSCPSGYSLDESDTVCVKCPIGHVKATADLSDCLKCAIGKEPNSGQTECKDCPSGKYKPTDEYFTCVDQPEPAATSSNMNSVALGFGTLPVSPLVFGAGTFGLGLFVMFILSIVCCRGKSSARRKADEEFNGGMTNTYGNTTSQRTFTNTNS